MELLEELFENYPFLRFEVVKEELNGKNIYSLETVKGIIKAHVFLIGKGTSILSKEEKDTLLEKAIEHSINNSMPLYNLQKSDDEEDEEDDILESLLDVINNLKVAESLEVDTGLILPFTEVSGLDHEEFVTLIGNNRFQLLKSEDVKPITYLDNRGALGLFASRFEDVTKEDSTSEVSISIFKIVNEALVFKVSNETILSLIGSILERPLSDLEKDDLVNVIDVTENKVAELYSYYKDIVILPLEWVGTKLLIGGIYVNPSEDDNNTVQG